MRLPAALVFALAATPALAVDLPARKAGLWELKMSMEGRAGAAMPTFQHCIDAATDKDMMMTSGMRAQKCSKQDVQKSGNTITIDSVCELGPGAGTTTSHAVVSGDFNSAYTVKVTSKREGGPSAPGVPAETNMTIDVKWLGACKADQQPGDVIMANGMKMNIRDMQKMGGPGGVKK